MVKEILPDKKMAARVSHNPIRINNSDIKLVKGEKGAVFTPYVDELSNISWTNNGGLDNPPPRNIRGRDGSTSIEKITNFDIERIMED